MTRPPFTQDRPRVFDVKQLFGPMHSPSQIFVGELNTQVVAAQIRKMGIADEAA